MNRGIPFTVARCNCSSDGALCLVEPLPKTNPEGWQVARITPLVRICPERQSHPTATAEKRILRAGR
jgi:hypothetical protein